MKIYEQKYLSGSSNRMLLKSNLNHHMLLPKKFASAHLRTFYFDYSKLSSFYVKNIKGDGIDVSFSYISLNSSTISNVKDKSISMGENLFMNINNVVLSGSDIVIALKDQSKIRMNNVEFSDNNIGFAEYIKKPHFEMPYVIEKNNVSYNGDNSDNMWIGFNP